LTGRYAAYYGHSLELKDDSTFRYEWKFDLASTWAVGHWTVSNKIIYLKFKDVRDRLTRDNQPDSLVLSANEKSNRIKVEEFAIQQTSGGRQAHSISDRLAIRGKKLYQMDNAGQIIPTKESGIWTKEKRQTYVFKVE
jgi:hypothetical protein